MSKTEQTPILLERKEIVQSLNNMGDLSELNNVIDGNIYTMMKTEEGWNLNCARGPSGKALFGDNHSIVKVFMDGDLNPFLILDTSAGKRGIKKIELDGKSEEILSTIEKMLYLANNGHQKDGAKESANSEKKIVTFINELQHNGGLSYLVHCVADDVSWYGLGHIHKWSKIITDPKSRINVINKLLAEPKVRARYEQLLLETYYKLTGSPHSIPEAPISHVRSAAGKVLASVDGKEGANPDNGDSEGF